MKVGKYEFVQGTDVKKNGKSTNKTTTSNQPATTNTFAQTLNAATQKKATSPATAVATAAAAPSVQQTQTAKVLTDTLPAMSALAKNSMMAVPAEGGQALAQEAGKAAQLQDLQKNLQAAAGSKDDTKLRKAAQEFESIFVGMMFKTMKTTVGDGGLMEKSYAREMFEDMYMDEVGKSIAQKRGTGLGDMIYKQLSRTYQTAEKADAKTDEKKTDAVADKEKT